MTVSSDTVAKASADAVYALKLLFAVEEMEYLHNYMDVLVRLQTLARNGEFYLDAGISIIKHLFEEEGLDVTDKWDRVSMTVAIPILLDSLDFYAREWQCQS